MRITLIAVTSGLAFAMVPSCKSRRDNPNHCQNNDGNDWCAERFPDRPFCSIGACTPDVEDGCMAERPADDACYSPCGDDQTFEENPSCDGVAETSTGATATESLSDTTPSTSGDPTTMSSMSATGTDTEETETTEPTTDTGPTGCVGSDECTDPGSPVCVDEVCVPCTEAGDGDAACAEKDSGAPACAGSGECVECTEGNPSACGGETPVCDGGSSSCVGCTYHEQCPDSACRISTGACFSTDCVVEVGGGGGPDTIGEAIGDGCVLVLHEGAGYTENVVLNGGDVVAIIAHETATSPVINGAVGTEPTVQVSNLAELYLQGVTISGNTGDGVGVEASGGGVWLDRTQVVANDGGGIELTDSATALVRNSFVQGSSADAAGIEVNGSRAEVLYTTIGGIDDGFGGGAAARCFEPTEFTIRNSLLFKTGTGAEIVCADVDVSYSALENAFDGDGNVALGSVMPGWFEGLAAGNYALLGPPDGVLTAAQWNTGDPATDIDGDLRPTVDGTPDVAGADIP